MRKIQKKENSLDLSNFTLLRDYVLVQAIREETVSEGLVKPENYDDKPEFGEVLAHGEGRLLDNGETVPTLVSVGDIVFFSKYSSEPIRTEGKDLFVIREDDVKAIRNNA